MPFSIAYLMSADNVLGPLPTHPRGQEPVLYVRNGFAMPRQLHWAVYCVSWQRAVQSQRQFYCAVVVVEETAGLIVT